MSVLHNIKWACNAPVLRRADGRPDSTAHHVLLALSTFSDVDGRCRPSLATLADASYQTKDTTRKALKRLVEARLIKNDGEYGNTGITVWVLTLGLTRGDVDAALFEDRRAREKKLAADRQRRFRTRRVTASDTVTGDGVGERDVTPSDGVTDDSVTLWDTVSNGVGDRYVTASDASSNGVDSVTSAAPGRHKNQEEPIEEPRRTMSPRASTKKSTEQKPPRPDVDQLCQRLADWIVRNGSKKPAIGKTWLDAARLLLDEDHRELPKALALIDWCQQDTFWRSNIQSMTKFRKQYDQLRLRANTEWEQRAGHRGYKPFQNPTTNPADYEKGWTA